MKTIHLPKWKRHKDNPYPKYIKPTWASKPWEKTEPRATTAILEYFAFVAQELEEARYDKET